MRRKCIYRFDKPLSPILSARNAAPTYAPCSVVCSRIGGQAKNFVATKSTIMLQSINRFQLYRISSTDQQVKLMATTSQRKMVSGAKANEQCYDLNGCHEACRKSYSTGILPEL